MNPLYPENKVFFLGCGYLQINQIQSLPDLRKGCVPWNFNPLNAELNPICHLLALLGAHHIFHVSGIRVKQVEFYVSRNSSKFISVHFFYLARRKY